MIVNFFVATSAPTAGTTNLAEGDLFYDTDDNQLKIYREVSSGTFQFVPIMQKAGIFLLANETLRSLFRYHDHHRRNLKLSFLALNKICLDGILQLMQWHHV